MKVRFPALLVTLALALCSVAHAQLTVENFKVVGSQTGVTAKFKFTVDPQQNTLTVEIDNTFLGAGGVRGTITSFGFNTPFTNSQLGTNGSNVTFTQTWTKLNSGHTTPTKWTKFDPYSPSQQGGKYGQDFGVGTGSTPEGGNANLGIKFGEKAKFVFTFPDFTASQVANFFNSADDLTARWQEVTDGTNYYCGSPSDIGFANELPPVPEPATYGLMGTLLLTGLVAYRRKVRSTHE
jgi:hypothetical protein